MMLKVRLVSILTLIFTSVLFLAASATIARAEAPKWSGGFPKLVQNDVLLQWNPVKGATEYKIYKSEQKDKDLKLVASVKANRHIDKAIGAGKAFYYYIVPVVGGKEGDRSVGMLITTAKEKVAVFVPLKVPKLAGAHVKELPGGKSTVGVRWEGTGGTDFVGVNVYRSSKKGKDYVMIGSSGSDTFEDTDVQPGSTYYYVVTAVDSQFKETKYSNELELKMPVPAVKEGPKAVEKTPPTKMRRAKLLYTVPARKGDKVIPGNAQGVAVDEATGHIYVTSFIYNGVLVYNMNGELQFTIRKDGVNGKKPIDIPVGVAVGENGNVYVLSYSSTEVCVFDFTGKPIETFNVDLSYIGKGAKGRLHSITFDKDGRIYLTDPAVNRVHVLDRNRKRLFDIVSSEKEADKKFNGPSFLTISNKGDIIFVDCGFSRLQEFSHDGKHKRAIGKMGSAAGDLNFPVGMATGKGGEIYVASAVTPNIQAFSDDGKFLYVLCNEKGDGPPAVGDMKGIFIDSKDRLYVAEGQMDRVSVFQLMEGTIELVPEK